MELEELKNKWRQLDKHVKAQDEKIRELTDQVMSGKVRTKLNTLLRHCRISVVVIPFLLPLFVMCYNFVGFDCPEWHRIFLYVVSVVFVLFVFIRELWFIYDLKQINVSRDSALVALNNTVRFRKHYQWGVLVAMILAVVLLASMLSAFNSVFQVGCIVGIVVGGIVGFRLYRYYKKIIDELETALREWSDVAAITFVALMFV